MSSFRSSVFALSVLLAPCALASAQVPWNQVPYPCLPFEPENVISWPDEEFGDASAFGRAVALELNADLAPDAVVVAGGVAVCLFDAVYYDVLQVIPGLTDVADVAVLPLGSDEDRDLLLVTHADGLVSLGWSEGAFSTPQVIARGPWVRARTLHVDDLDGDGPDDVVGIPQAGLTVVTRIGNGTGFPAGPAYSIGSQVYDAVALYYDNDTTRDLAVVAENGLHVFEGTTQIAFEAHPSSFGCIARVRCTDTTPPAEVLAWARSPSSGGGAELVVRGQRNEGPEPLYFTDVECSIGQFVPRAMLSGRYDGITGDELLLVSDTKSNAIVLRNLGTSSAGLFETSDNTCFDIVRLCQDPTPFTGVGIPAFAQLDLDGPDDLLFPVKGTDEVVAYRTLPYVRTNYQPGEEPTSDNVFPGYSEFTTASVPNDGRLRLGFKILDQYRSYDRALLKIWKQSESELVEGEFGDLEHDPAFYAMRHDLLMAQTQVESQWQWVAIEKGFEPGTFWEPQTHYYVELRFQRTVGVQQSSPKFFGGFTLPDDDYENPGLELDCFDHLRDIAIPNKGFPVLTHNSLTTAGGGVPAEQLVGAYFPMNSLPQFQGGGLPKTGEVGNGQEAQRFADEP